MAVDESILILSAEDHESKTSVDEIVRRSTNGDVHVFIARNMKQVVELENIASKSSFPRIALVSGFVRISDREDLVIDRMSYLNADSARRVVITALCTEEEAARAKVLKAAAFAAIESNEVKQ